MKEKSNGEIYHLTFHIPTPAFMVSSDRSLTPFLLTEIKKNAHSQWVFKTASLLVAPSIRVNSSSLLFGPGGFAQPLVVSRIKHRVVDTC